MAPSEGQATGFVLHATRGNWKVEDAGTGKPLSQEFLNLYGARLCLRELRSWLDVYPNMRVEVHTAERPAIRRALDYSDAHLLSHGVRPLDLDERRTLEGLLR